MRNSHWTEDVRTELKLLKSRCNILFREWSPRLGDELNNEFMLGGTAEERIADAQRVIDLTNALVRVINTMQVPVCAALTASVRVMKRRLAAQKGHAARKARRELRTGNREQGTVNQTP